MKIESIEGSSSQDEWTRRTKLKNQVKVVQVKEVSETFFFFLRWIQHKDFNDNGTCTFHDTNREDYGFTNITEKKKKKKKKKKNGFCFFFLKKKKSTIVFVNP